MAFRILLVEDTLANKVLAVTVLQHAGYSVTTADCAEFAQALLADVVPDLVLVDIALPGMDGLAFTRWLKADPRLKRVPVVAITAFAMPGNEKTALDAGCAGYITKPVDIEALPRSIERILQRAQEKPPQA